MMAMRGSSTTDRASGADRGAARPVRGAAVPRHADEPDIDVIRLIERHMRQTHEGRDTGKSRHFHAGYRLKLFTVPLMTDPFLDFQIAPNLSQTQGPRNTA